MVKSDLPRLLTLTEAAEVMRCSKDTVRRRITDGKLRAVRHGRVVRVDLADVRALFRSTKRWQ